MHFELFCVGEMNPPDLLELFKFLASTSFPQQMPAYIVDEDNIFHAQPHNLVSMNLSYYQSKNIVDDQSNPIGRFRCYISLDDQRNDKGFRFVEYRVVTDDGGDRVGGEIWYLQIYRDMRLEGIGRGFHFVEYGAVTADGGVPRIYNKFTENEEGKRRSHQRYDVADFFRCLSAYDVD